MVLKACLLRIYHVIYWVVESSLPRLAAKAQRPWLPTYDMKLSKYNEASYAHFVTTKTFQNKPIFNNSKSCELLLEDIDFYRNKLGFKLIGYVIMPNHLHLIVWWDVEKQKGLTISKIIQSIKSHSAK